MRSRPLLASFALFACATVVLCAPAARAQPNVIGVGQERTVLALLEPHRLGGEVEGGYLLWNVAIESNRIEIVLRDGEGAETSMTLRHPDDTWGGRARTESFAVVLGEARDARAAAAQRAIVDAIRANDRGAFWQVARSTATYAREPSGAGGWAQIRAQLGVAGWIPVDGLAMLLAIWSIALVLAVRLLRNEPRWMAAALGGTVALGALVRLALSPATFLGAWPWSRLYPHVRGVSEGRWLAAIGELVGETFFLTDVAMWTNFAYAAAMPLVLFAHATYLLRDARAGLAASLMVAFLPQHVRYSRCEDGFVASLVLTSLAFATIHGFLRDRERLVRWPLLVVLPLVLYPGYLLRPLNIAFVLVYAAAIVCLHRHTAPLGRRAGALAMVLGVGALATHDFVVQNPEPIADASSNLEWLANTFVVLAWPPYLVLTDPTKTPPLLLVLAVAGGVLAWRHGERALVLFLCGWLLTFVALHAFVIQESMQPRYHLHLAVPFLLLAACAVPRLPARFRRWLPAGVVVLALSPLLHLGFVQDVDYAELHEYELVRSARDEVPPGCTVLELTTSPYEVDELRFSRIGALAGGDRAHRFRAIGVFADGRTSPGQPSLDEIVASPPECLYLYEGLACTAARAHGEAYADLCVALRERLRAEPVLETRVPARFYDRSTVGEAPLPVSEIPLRLSRARLGERGGT